jgi:hypothetical protein
MSDDMRTKKITVRYTVSELERANENANGKLAVWLRDLSLHQKPKRVAKPVNAQLLYELNRIGVNLNQIAKSCNVSNLDRLTRADILIQLAEIHEELIGLRNHYDS